MENQTKMFWGLVLENGKQYKQTSKFNFHVSRAVLDLKSCDDSEQVGVYVQVDNTDYLLCNLNKKDSTQSSLDLMFCEGEKIKFYATGKASIHLTGYILPDDEIDDAFMDEDSELSDEELSIEDDLANKANNKRKNTETLKLGENAKKIKGQPENAKKIIDVDTKQLVKKEQPKKNVPAKPAAKKAEDDSDDDDLSIDEDEESVDINDLMNMESDDDDELDSNDEDLESDDEDDDLKKLKDVKNKVKFANGQNKQNQKNKPNGSFNKPQNKSPQQNKNMQQNKNQQNTPHNKNQQNTPQNKNQQNTPQNKNQQNTPQNKSQQKHQQTPFHNKNQKNSGKKGTPFNKNKTPGSQNKARFQKN